MNYQVSNRFLIGLILILVISGTVAVYLNSKKVNTATTSSKSKDTIIEEWQKDSTRIIVNFDIPFTPEGNLSSREVSEQRRSITKAQSDLLGKLDGYNYRVTAQFQFIPAIGLEVENTAMEYLQSLPGISAIEEDRVGVPF